MGTAVVVSTACPGARQEKRHERQGYPFLSRVCTVNEIEERQPSLDH